MGVIICTAEGVAEMRENILANKKIAAIKALRAAATPPEGEKCIGLREAKQAVERYAYEIMGQQDYASAYSNNKGTALPIVAGPVVKEIIVDFGTGPVTVDVEAMELKALSQLESIGLEACGRMLELCQVIKAFSEGKRVGVIEEAKDGDC